MESFLNRWRSGNHALNIMSGLMLLVALVLNLLGAMSAAISGGVMAAVVGTLIWIPALLLAPAIKPAQKKQIGVLLVVGLAGLLFASVCGDAGRFWLKALEANQLVVVLLIGVSFLRLVALAGVAVDESLPVGPLALQRSLFGTHIFAAVLNISAILIVGDRLAHARASQPLHTVQGLMLLRAFSACAFWSPFFAAMGLALLSAPGSSLSTLMLMGVPVALVALGFSAWELGRHPQVTAAMGYPMHWASLWMPILLSVLVMVAHLLWPAMAVVSLVTLIAVLFVVGWLLIKRGRAGASALKQHVEQGLPNLCSEIALFLGAAVLASGVAATLDALQISLAPANFGFVEAVLTLLALLAAAMAGMHPVTSVVLAGSLLGSSVTDPDLFAMTLLMGWALGIGLSPLSGIQLTLQARYGLRARALLKENGRYAALMLVVCVITLYVCAGRERIFGL